MLVHLVLKKKNNKLINGQKKILPTNLQSLVKCDCPLLLNMFWPSLFQDDFYDSLVRHYPRAPFGGVNI